MAVRRWLLVAAALASVCLCASAFDVYRTMVTDAVYVPTALGMAFLISVMYGFEVLAPFYIQDDLGRSAVDYGHLQFALGGL